MTIKKIELSEESLRVLFNAEIDMAIKEKTTAFESYLTSELQSRSDFERLIDRKVEQLSNHEELSFSANIHEVLNSNKAKIRAAIENIEELLSGWGEIIKNDKQATNDINKTIESLNKKECFGFSYSFTSYKSRSFLWVSYTSPIDDFEINAKKIYDEVLGNRLKDLGDFNEEIRSVKDFIRKRIKNETFKKDEFYNEAYLLPLLSELEKEQLNEEVKVNPAIRKTQAKRL